MRACVYELNDRYGGVLNPKRVKAALHDMLRDTDAMGIVDVDASPRQEKFVEDLGAQLLIVFAQWGKVHVDVCQHEGGYLLRWYPVCVDCGESAADVEKRDGEDPLCARCYEARKEG